MQLEFVFTGTSDSGAKKFQSHIGAIRIEVDFQDVFKSYLFQSHIGAIRIEHLNNLEKKYEEISIPHWCN